MLLSQWPLGRARLTQVPNLTLQIQNQLGTISSNVSIVMVWKVLIIFAITAAGPAMLQTRIPWHFFLTQYSTKN